MKYWIAVVLGCLLSLDLSAQQRIWVDTDILMGKFGKDVDDGLALMMLLQSDAVEIAGISNVHKIEHGYKVTRKLVNWYSDTDIPVYKGARGKEELGQTNAAVEALAAALRKEKLTILALGPLTNIGTLIKQYPELHSQIERVVFCGGRKPGYHFSPGNSQRNMNDYNFDLDPEAAELLLDSEIPVTLGCYEQASYIQLNKWDVKRLKKNGRRGDRWVARQCNSWRLLWKLVLKEDRGFMPFDATVAGFVLAPEYFEYYHSIPTEIQVYENDANTIIKTDEKPYLVVDHKLRSDRQVQYVYYTHPAFKQYMMELLLGKP